jgi:hypothetical protein
MTYACLAWEFASDTHVLKPQCLQNKVLCTSGKFPRCTSVCNLHTAFKVPYVYNYITKLRKQRSYKIIKMQMSVTLGKEKPNRENIRGLSLAWQRSCVQPFKQLSSQCNMSYIRYGMICSARPRLTEALYTLYI